MKAWIVMAVVLIGCKDAAEVGLASTDYALTRVNGGVVPMEIATTALTNKVFMFEYTATASTAIPC